MKLILISPWTACGFLRTVVPWRKKERRPKVRKVHGGRERGVHVRAKGWVCVSTRRPNRFQLGSVERWLCTNCPQLSFTSWLATRSRQIFPYGFAGKSYHRDGIKKIQMPRRMSFRGLRTSLSSVTRGGGGILEWKKEEKKNRNSFPPYLIEVLRNLYFIQIFFKSLFFSLSLL